MITTNGIGPIKAGAFLSVTGQILNEEFPTLNTIPHVILPAIGGTYIVHSFILELNWTVRASVQLGLGYSPLINTYGAARGGLASIALSVLPAAGYFGGGSIGFIDAVNVTTGAPLVWMTEGDDAAAQYETAFYQIFYSIVNPV